MRDGVVIRLEEDADRPGIRAIHEAAFGGPAEANLVEALREEGDLVLALTAFADRPVGHIAFPRLTLEGSDLRVVALAPLAVLPGRHRAGIGTGLVRIALETLTARGEDFVLVRGHPPYYARFGFAPEPARRVRTPYDEPALQALALSERGREAAGLVHYPPAFARLLGGRSQ
jgi:putative acetyltransferase